MIRPACTALLAALPFAASAAGLPTRSQFLPVADPFTGFYVGGAAGYASSISPIGFTYTDGTVSDLGGTTNAPHGTVAGGYAGYGARVLGSFYVGGEGNLDWSSIKGTGTVPPTIIGEPLGQLGIVTSDRWMASVRGRYGFVTPGGVLLYGTAGWGWAGAQMDLNTAPNQTAAVTTASFSRIVDGAVWGGGVEFPLMSANWLGRVQYLRYNLGTMSISVPAGTFSQPDRAQVIQGGLAYKF